MRKTSSSIFFLAGLSGCTTVSFAPPAIDVERAMTTRVGLGHRCVVVPKGGQAGILIEETVDGARNLIDNFVHNYRCTANAAANGRQYTEVPAFLSLAGSTAAVAFGAGPNVAIAGGVANSVLTNAGKYYAAQMKAEIYNHALDALLCIKTEAVGIDAFTLKAMAAVEESSATPTLSLDAVGDQSGPEVGVSSVKQYFDMVSASLMAVERVTAQRLSVVGTAFDAAGVVAEIESLAQKEAEANDATAVASAKAKALKDAPAPTEGNAALFSSAKAGIVSIPSMQVAETILKLSALQPKLQQCVVRAKI